MDKQLIRRLVALGDTEQHAEHLYNFYEKMDDVATLKRCVELRESSKPEPSDKRFYHSY